MPKIVQLQPDADDQEAIIDILEDALEKARSGEMKDVAVAAVLKRDGEDPTMWCKYWAEAQYGTLVGSVSALAFDLHYRRYGEDV